MKVLSSPIQRLFPKRIWHQIFVVLAFVVVIPLIVLGLLLIRTSQKAIKNNVFLHHKEVAVQATDQVTERIEGARQAMLITASLLSSLSTDPWRQETAVVELSLNNPAFQRVSAVDSSGKETATSELGSLLRVRSNEYAFRQAMAGDTYISNVRMTDEDVPYLTIAVPLINAGKTAGALLAELNVRGIWDKVDQIQFGEAGLAYIIDRNGQIIAHRDKKLVMRHAQVPSPKILQDIINGRPGNTTVDTDEGGRLLMSYAPIRSLGWGLVISQPERDAYAMARTMHAQSWIIILLGIIATVVTSYFLARYVSHPINEIIAGTERLAKGDFSHRFRVRQRNEIGKLMFSFNRMTAQLRKARDVRRLSVIGEAAASLAHELKNSLQMVTTFVKLLPERSNDKEFIKEFADTIPGELDNWNASLRNMMIFSQREAPFPTVPVDINELLADLMLFTKLKLRQMDITIVDELTPNLPSVEANEEKLKQVILNLLTNALETAPTGTTVSLSSHYRSTDNFQESPQIEIILTNQCPQIDEFDSHKIFEPFYTTKPGGTGLGLSISREIIERHGGSIRAKGDSQTQQVAFIIRLPASPILKQNSSLGLE